LYGAKNSKTENGKGRILNPNREFSIKGDCFLLDIDLDAFCCKKGRCIDFAEKGHGGFKNWRQRINTTTNYLKNLLAPDLITITRSTGNVNFMGARYNDYVPLSVVGNVESYLLKRLKQTFK